MSVSKGSLVLEYLFKHGEQSQGQLMHAFDMSQRAMSNVLGRLHEHHEVELRFGYPEDRGGRHDGPNDWLYRLPHQNVGSRRSRASRNIMDRAR